MPRIARVVATQYPHHVTQRGNYRQTVFETDGDYLKYIEWLKEYKDKYGLDIWAYCLLGNHVHFVCVPKQADTLSRTFNMLHMRYSQYVNARRGLSGHVWQGRFYSSILDDRHTYAAVRYVENNPVRAGLVGKAEEYRWSSARGHIDGRSDGIVSLDCYLTKTIPSWIRYLREKEDETVLQSIRKHTMIGRPCGEDGFVENLEKRFGCRLRALAHGRPKKKEDK